MTKTEQRRLLVLNHLESGALVEEEAAKLLGLSGRQVRRLRAAYRTGGAAALAHGNRGRRPHNALPEGTAQKVIELATTTYAGFNRQHLTEMLADHHGLELSRPTVHRILSAAGIPSPRKRRAPKHRRRRDRYPKEGMLLQLDASRHDWLEGRGPRLSLVGGIDDATGVVPWACFRDQEDAQGYFEVMREVTRRKGVPLAVYADRHSIFFQTQDKDLTLEEQLEGKRTPTQFGRLLDELGVQLILALSPQAKGRIERLWGTFQDRLTSELRLAGASTREEAQRVLAGFLPRHNKRFAVAAKESDPAWLRSPTEGRLRDIFCFKYRRVVANDNTVRFGKLLVDLPASVAKHTYARARVQVHQEFDGTVSIHYQGACLVRKAQPEPGGPLRILPHSRTQEEAPARRTGKTIDVAEVGQPRARYKPPASHPWKSGFKADWALSRTRSDTAR